LKKKVEGRLITHHPIEENILRPASEVIHIAANANRKSLTFRYADLEIVSDMNIVICLRVLKMKRRIDLE
jgi:hypothetical protein